MLNYQRVTCVFFGWSQLCTSLVRHGLAGRLIIAFLWKISNYLKQAAKWSLWALGKTWKQIYPSIYILDIWIGVLGIPCSGTKPVWLSGCRGYSWEYLRHDPRLNSTPWGKEWCTLQTQQIDGIFHKDHMGCMCIYTYTVYIYKYIYNDYKMSWDTYITRFYQDFPLPWETESRLRTWEAKRHGTQTKQTCSFLAKEM
jgi:hypothetical protein